MANFDFLVRALAADDHLAWLEMWRGYCAFYAVDLPAAVTSQTWRRIQGARRADATAVGDDAIAGIIAIRRATGEPLGFAHAIRHAQTWSESPTCYLEDLFVRPEARGAGVGRALIEQVMADARAARCSRVYWMTRETNVAARRFYDQFAERDDFVRYVVELDA